MKKKLNALKSKLSQPEHPMHNMFQDLVAKGKSLLFLQNSISGNYKKHNAFE